MKSIKKFISCAAAVLMTAVFISANGINTLAFGSDPAGISLNVESSVLLTGETLQLEVTFQPQGASDKVTFSSSNSNAAEVDSNGLVTALRYSSKPVIITATTDNGQQASCSISTRYYDAPDASSYPGKYVYWAADKGITQGYDNVYFGVGENCTRESFAIFLWRYAGCPKAKGTMPFNDCGSYKQSSSAYKAIIWASANGIVKGYSDGGFHPGAYITRVEVMIMLYRYKGKPAVSGTVSFADVRPIHDPVYVTKSGKKYHGPSCATTSGKKTSALSKSKAIKEGYTPCAICKPDAGDYSETSDSYKSILWGVKKGITKGYPDTNTFRPGANCKREEMVTFLSRLK